LVLGIASAKSLREAESQIQALRQEIEDFEEKSRRQRVAEATYLFSGDLTVGARDVNADRSDLNMTDYWTLQKQCYDVFKIFPYAKRVIEMTTDFVIGTELTFSVDEEIEAKYKGRIKGYITDLWEDYDNDFDLMLEGMCNELWILGEQIYPFTFEDTTNILKLGIVDPRMIEKIVRDKVNQKRLAQVVMQPDMLGKVDVYGIVHENKRRLGVPDTAKSFEGNSEYGYNYAGDAFLFQVNRLPTQTRGYSELATMVESLDVMDQFMFEVCERSLLMFHFIADVLIKNKTDEEIKNFPVPNMKKNTVFKHSQNVELNLKSPDLKAIDAESIVRLVTRYILAGCGIPEHWIVNGGDTNLATAKEQNTPIEKRLERKQGTVKYMLKKIIRAQLERKLKNATPEEIREIMKGVNIDFPSVSGVDRKLQAQVLTETAKALVIGTSQGWITGEDAGQEFINTANKFGMELSAMHLDDANQKQLSDLTGNKIKQVNDIQSYFKSVDQVVKQQGSGLANGLVPADTK